jgi:hypothetical protein
MPWCPGYTDTISSARRWRTSWRKPAASEATAREALAARSPQKRLVAAADEWQAPSRGCACRVGGDHRAGDLGVRRRGDELMDIA